MKKKETVPEHWNTLDVPIAIWAKVHETCDLSHLLIKKQPITKSIIGILQGAWDKMYDEYMNEFGKSQLFIDLKQKEIKLARMKLKFIIYSDRSMLTDIELFEIELNEMRKDMGNYKFGDSKIAIEMNMKFQINMNTTRTYDFYDYLRALK